jgi:hypothetical protein
MTKDKQIAELRAALEGMIQALRKQARTATYYGGEIALCEENGPAWDKARKALALTAPKEDSDEA